MCNSNSNRTQGAQSPHNADSEVQQPKIMIRKENVRDKIGVSTTQQPLISGAMVGMGMWKCHFDMLVQ